MRPMRRCPFGCPLALSALYGAPLLWCGFRRLSDATPPSVAVGVFQPGGRS